jgi:hypothetical protein
LIRNQITDMLVGEMGKLLLAVLLVNRFRATRILVREVEVRASHWEVLKLLPRVYQHVRCYKLEYRLYIYRATTGAHIEVYGCA